MRLPNWLRTRRALEQKAANWERRVAQLEDEVHDKQVRIIDANKRASEWREKASRLRDRAVAEAADRDEARAEIARMRDDILHLAEYVNRRHDYTGAEDMAEIATRLRNILDPAPTEPGPFGVKCELVAGCTNPADGVFERTWTCRQHYAELNAAPTEPACDLAPSPAAPNSLATHLEAQAVQRQVDNRVVLNLREGHTAPPCSACEKAMDAQIAHYCGGAA